MEKEPAESVVAGKTPRHRSPNYPSITLREAVGHSKTLWEKDGKYGCMPETAVKYFGFTSMHGASKGVVSALKKYDLVEEGKDGRLMPTETTSQLALLADQANPIRIEALKHAALAPPIYRALWDRFSQVGHLPSDETFRYQLIQEQKFNPKSVEGFIADFKDTLEYAGLLTGNRLGVGSDGASDVPPPTPDPPSESDADKVPAQDPPPSSGGAGRKERAMDQAFDPTPMRIPIGFTKDGQVVYGSLSFNVPVRPGLIRRLIERLEPMAKDDEPIGDDD